MFRDTKIAAVRPEWVFLDRDGTINVSPPEHEYITDPDQLALIPGAGEAVAKLNRAGIWVGVVTNQRGVALGELSLDTLAAIHARLGELLAEHGAHVDGIWTCPHYAGQCDCRKPQPGLLIQAQRATPQITFDRAAMIGDAPGDIAAGQAVGARTIKLGSAVSGATSVAPDLSAAVDLLLAG